MVDIGRDKHRLGASASEGGDDGGRLVHFGAVIDAVAGEDDGHTVLLSVEMEGGESQAARLGRHPEG